jgi:hypothetical protein
MQQDRTEALLGVKWYDGLLVRCDHLAHTDSRILNMFSESIGIASEQPGLIHVDSRNSVDSHLVSIKGLRKQGEALEITFRVLHPFISLAPDRNLVMAMPDGKGQAQGTSPETKIPFPPPNRVAKEYLLCLQQAGGQDLSVKKMCNADEFIDLVYPTVTGDLVDPDRYMNYFRTKCRSSTPVALVVTDGNTVDVAASYVPPMTKLEVVRHFDNAILDSLENLMAELTEVVLGYLRGGGHVISRADVGVDLRTRYNYYNVLSSLLLSKAGLVRNLGGTSPVRFLNEIMYPLATWFDQYLGSLKERRHSLAEADAAASKVRLLSGSDVCLRTDHLLTYSREFLYELNETLKEMG